MLVERDHQLEALGEVFDAPSQGSVVLVSGEAGHGKTSLVNEVVECLDHRYQILRAACEPLEIPAGFGPLFDLVAELPPELVNDLKAGSGRMPVYAGMLDQIKNERVVLVIEDLHWADEATLGLARYLGRRMSSTDSVLILTYRTEELGLNPRLRLVVADLGPQATRIVVPALSIDGVRKLASGTDLDAVTLHDRTKGNPLFVDEVLRDPALEVPETIQNAVVANANFLEPEAREVLDLVVLSPEGLAVEVVDRLLPLAAIHSDACVKRGLIESDGKHLVGRHELVRQSLVNVMPPAYAQQLHQRLLLALEERSLQSPDISRLAYHSLGAGDARRTLRYSLQAATHSSQSGAHREAAFHLDNALESGAPMSDTELARWLLEAANEHLFINNFEEAVDLSRRRVDLFTDYADVAGARAWYAFFLLRLNEYAAAESEAESTIDILREGLPTEELAVALYTLSGAKSVMNGASPESIVLAEEAVEVARIAGSRSFEVGAMVSSGSMRWFSGDKTGLSRIQEGVELGLSDGAGEFTPRALNVLAWLARDDWDLAEAARRFEDMKEYCSGNEYEAWYMAGVVTGGAIAVDAGRWDEADAELETVWGQRTCFSSEIELLVAAATLRVRRGDPGVAEMLESVFARADGFEGPDERFMACALALEAAWAGVIPTEVATNRYRNLSGNPYGGRYLNSHLSFWVHRMGLGWPDLDISGPVELERQGLVAQAAEEWLDAGYPLHAAITRATGPGADIAEAIRQLGAMGAEGSIRGMRRELRRLGVKSVPRGERDSTRSNPQGLTDRELEVLHLVALGHTNSAIANDLFISEKTAGHHVSSILSKLGVSSRGQAAARAVSGGWVESI